jgi:hypothetical protein
MWNRGKCKIEKIRMLQHKENYGLLYTVTMENHLKYTRLNTNNVNVNVNENTVLGLFYNGYQLMCMMRWWL